MRFRALAFTTSALLLVALALGAEGPVGGPPAPIAAPASPATPVPDGDISRRSDRIDFGQTRDGAANQLFILRNRHGATLKVMTYGAAIQEISMPDKAGSMANVVLSSGGTFNQGFRQLANTIGRVANRVAGGKFTLDGREYILDASGRTILHSGAANFGTRIWQGELLPEKRHETSARFTMSSKDGDGAFPGDLVLHVTFTLTDDNEVRLEYEGTSDRTTLLAPTNHAYFNLGGTMMEYDLWINADHYTPGGEGREASLIPNGEIAPVAGTPFDFTRPTRINSRNDGIYDINFVLNKWKVGKQPGGGARGLALAARVTDPASGRVLEVRTDQPGLQIYTGGRNGIALETQHFPDSMHHDNFPSTKLTPGETFRSKTVYRFSLQK
jgi:aldose 1-epimerase